MDARWNNLLDALRTAHEASAALQGFCAFPQTPKPQEITAKHDPLCDAMAADRALHTDDYLALRDALVAAAPLGQWRDTYRDTPIGEMLHSNFGTYEIIGRDAPFASEEMRGFVIYQRPGYHYPMHQHPAEEMYLVLAGEAEFHAQGEQDRFLRPGGTMYHSSGQPHALTTHDSPVLAYVVWQGDLTTKPVFCDPELQA